MLSSSEMSAYLPPEVRSPSTMETWVKCHILKGKLGGDVKEAKTFIRLTSAVILELRRFGFAQGQYYPLCFYKCYK